MHVVHVNYDAAVTGGASIAMLRLHHAMLDNGIKSRIMCRVRAEVKDSTAIKIKPLRKLLIVLSKLYMKGVSGACHSSGFFFTGMADAINELNPDMVILHWIQSDTISIREIKRIKAPIFWFHHDLWPIRGLTAYEWFSVPRNLNWLDKLCLKNKVKLIRELCGRVIPVCASNWVASQIRNSKVFAGIEPVVIPLPTDSVFCIGHRIPSRKFRILFGARGGLDSGLKGGDRLIAALGMIPYDERQDMELMVFGGLKGESSVHGIEIVNVGRCTGEELAQVYRNADVFAFPSRQETYGQTKIEAMACGTPVVVFDETACAEGVYHKINGWIAKADDISDYSEGIRWIYHLWKTGRAMRVGEDFNNRNAANTVDTWLAAYKNRKTVMLEQEGL